MFGRNVFHAAVDGFAEFGEGVVVSAVENVAFDELPKSFDQVQIWRIRRQELELMPVASSIRRLTSAVVCGGSTRNISSREV